MLVQSIFGLQAQQVIRPEFLDVKYLYDESWLWRARTRKAVAKARMVKTQLETARFLVHRRVLTMELESIRLDIRMRHRMYRGVYHDALMLERLYRASLKTLSYRWAQEDAAA